MLKKIKTQWFLLALIAISVLVAVDSSHMLEQIGIAIKTWDGPEIIIFLIFIVSGLMLDGEQIRSGIRDTKATALALFTILVVAPAIAWLIALFPLDTGVVIGLFIVSVMPTTLSSGVVMTRTAGGNMAHALFVTVISNIIAIFSIPLVLSFLLSTQGMYAVLAIDKEKILVKQMFC